MRVSVAFPCWNRGKLLERTLRSIFAQKFVLRYDIDLFVLESGDDGLTRKVAEGFGCRYAQHPREEYPLFQSITEMWNRCWREAKGDIVILQTAEVEHQSHHVIEQLVERVTSAPKVLATAPVKNLREDGTFEDWYSHPTLGSRAGWVSGAGPHAFRKAEMEEIGGYEQLFYGYGGEDNFWLYLLGKNGWSIEYVEDAVCAHQWHPRTVYEPITGYANRSLTNVLVEEIESGERKPIANSQPFRYQKGPSLTRVSSLILEIASKQIPMGEVFREWAESWLAFQRNVDLTFVAQRKIANEGLPNSRLGEFVTEAAWALLRERETREELVRESKNGQRFGWALRILHCAEVHATWARMALDKAERMVADA